MQKFAEQVAAANRLKEIQRAALAEFNILFASLQHRAFRGELRPPPCRAPLFWFPRQT